MIRIIKARMPVGLARAKDQAERQIERLNAELEQLRQRAAQIQQSIREFESQANAIIEGAGINVPVERIQETMTPDDLEPDEDGLVQIAFAVSVEDTEETDNGNQTA